MVRIPMIITSMLLTSIGIARLQLRGSYLPFTRDFEYLPHITAAIVFMTSLILTMLNDHILTERFLLKETIDRLKKEHELQSILFSFDGANIMF